MTADTKVMIEHAIKTGAYFQVVWVKMKPISRNTSMPTNTIETTGTVIDEDDKLNAAELAICVVAACGRTPEGNMCARPMVPKELLQADATTIRNAIRSTIPPKWLEMLPNLDAELNAITENQLRMLLVMNSSFWCMGRIEGTLEERARHQVSDE